MSAVLVNENAPSHTIEAGSVHLFAADRHRGDERSAIVGREPSPPGTLAHAKPNTWPSRADALLLICADSLDDLERVRIATGNRLRALTAEAMEGPKGGTFGKGLDPDSPEARRLAGMLDGLAALEHAATLELQRAMRQHPLGPWVKATVGIGEKQGARLLAAIGDPASRRTVSQLWAYCGYHVLPAAGRISPDTQSRCAGSGDPSSDPGQGPGEAHNSAAGVAPRRQKGVKANWNSTAKMRAYLVAESCMKVTGSARTRRSPYRDVYEARRSRTAETHPGWSDGHSHNDALRVTAKAILRDLWIEAKRLEATP